MSEKPKTNVLFIARDDVDHTRVYRLAQPTVTLFGVTTEPKAEIETAAGVVYATTTCKVVIEHKSRSSIMAEDEARELSNALLLSISLVRDRDKKRKGLHLRKITINNDGTFVTHGGITMAIRIQKHTATKSRYRPHVCHECRSVIKCESYVSERYTDLGWGPKKRVGEVRICLDCFSKLIVDNEPLTLVRKP